MKTHSIKLLSGLGLTLAIQWAHAGAAITDIQVTKIGGSEHALKITFDGPAPTPNSFSMAAPPRIAFDFSDTPLKLAQKIQEPGNPLIRQVAAVEANGRTRIVLNLASNAAYSNNVAGNTVNVTLNGNPSATAGSTTPTERLSSPSISSPQSMVAVASSDMAPSAVNMDFRRGSEGEGKIEINLPSHDTPVDVRKEGGGIVVDLIGTRLPSRQERKLNVVDFGTPVQKIDAFNRGTSGRLMIQPKGAWEYSSYQTDRKLVIEVRAAKPLPALKDQMGVLSTEKKEYKGDKLSLNFQNIEVRTVLQVIADFTGLNIITSDSVSGSITLRLKDVPWDQALALILDTKGLDQRRQGNVIHIAPRSELAARDKEILEARKALEVLEPLRSETFVLRYKSVEEFRKVLNITDGGAAGSGGKNTIISDRGSALIDPKTNTLIITDTPSVLDNIRTLIQQLDIAQRQVLIEARIVEANDNFQRDLGVKLGYQNSFQNGGFSNSFDGAKTSAADSGSNPFSLLNPNINLPAVATSAGTVAIVKRMFGGLIGLELSAMQAENKGKVVSSPRILTSDRTEANIEEGTEIPYQEASSSGATSTSFKKAVLSLKVKPQITPDNNVIMDLQVNKDAPVAGAIGTPAISTKKVQTQVLVENGGTIVIGGIYIESDGEVENKVPLLGDIPILGNLFKNQNRNRQKRELLVFITPRIVDDKAKLN